MKILFTILIISFISFTSCSKKGKHHLHQTSKKITFNTGFPIRNLNRELVHFRVNNSDYVAFANFSSYKQISVNSMNGSQLFSVPLANFMEKNLVNLIAFDVINLDSFALLSEYSDKVFLIKKNGKKIQVKDYSNLLLQGIYLYPPFNFDNKILKTSIRWGPVTDTLTSNERNHINNYFPILFVDSNYTKNNSSISFQLDSIYSRFTKDNEVSIELPQYLPIGNKTLFKSDYTDSIYLFNSEGKIDTIVKITSSNFKLDFKPVTEKSIEQNGDVDAKDGPLYKHAKIRSIKYDSSKQLIYVILEGPKRQNEYSDFSIILYNKNFKKLDEKLIKGKKFTRLMFVTPEGLYVRNRKKSLKTITFTLFRYE